MLKPMKRSAMKNMPKQNIDAEVQKVLQQVNLSERQNDRIGTLSGGMLRRLGIAQAILGDPEVLIVDEPTVGLDPEERKHFRRLLADIAENRIVLISTHIVEDIAEISTELIVMKNGKIIAEGTANEALAQSRHFTPSANIADLAKLAEPLE